MRRGPGLCGAIVVASIVLAALVGAQPASAHVVRQVGAYQFVVGWGTEPAYVGQENSVQLLLSSRATGKPVVNLGLGLHVTVVYGTRSVSLPLEPTFDPDTGLGTPGDYRAWLFPTSPGDYTFRFTGTIGAQKIDQSFTSGPTTFATVQDPEPVEFPVQAPTMTELAQRVSVALPRVATGAETSRALVFGIVGVVVGAAGLVVGIVALRTRRA